MLDTPRRDSRSNGQRLRGTEDGDDHCGIGATRYWSRFQRQDSFDWLRDTVSAHPRGRREVRPDPRGLEFRRSLRLDDARWIAS